MEHKYEKEKEDCFIDKLYSNRLFVLGGVAYSYHLQAEGYKLQLENDYQRAFSELVSGVSELDPRFKRACTPHRRPC
jgi:hypothetical protein